MFWTTELAADAVTTGLVEILDQSDVTLEKVLDHEFLLSELKAGNEKLVKL